MHATMDVCSTALLNTDRDCVSTAELYMLINMQHCMQWFALSSVSGARGCCCCLQLQLRRGLHAACHQVHCRCCLLSLRTVSCAALLAAAVRCTASTTALRDLLVAVHNYMQLAGAAAAAVC
jgi:hypothetical protein